MALSHSHSGIDQRKEFFCEICNAVAYTNPEDNWRIFSIERSRNRIEFLLPAHSSCFLYNLRCFLAKRRFPSLPVMTLRQKSVPVLDKDDPITGLEDGPRVFEFLSRNPLMIVVNIRKELKTSESDSSEGWRCIYRRFHANQSPVHEIFKFFRLLPVDRAICMIQIEIKFKCYAKK